MYRYATLYQNIWCGSRIMSMFAKRPRPAKKMLVKASSSFCIPMTGQNYKNKYAKIDSNVPYGSSVTCMSILTNLPQLAEMLLCKLSSMTKGCYTCQWLNNVGMHFYANFGQNRPCGSILMSIFTNS